MTTKYKIVVGFLLMNVFLIIVAYIAVTNISTATREFVSYNGLARANLYLNSGWAKFYYAGYNAAMFMVDHSPEQVDVSQKMADEAVKDFVEANKLITDPQRTATINELINSLNSYKGHVNSVRQQLLESLAQYKIVVDSAAIITNSNTLWYDEALRAGNVASLETMASLFTKFTDVRAQVARFSESQNVTHAELAAKNLADFEKILAGARTLAVSEDGKKYSAQLVDALSKYKGAFENMVKLTHQFVATQQQLRNTLQLLDERITKFNADAGKELGELGDGLLASNNSAQAQVLTIGIAGVIIGILLAIYIIFSIVRVLSKLSNFASDISEGKFDSTLDVREKGEIGVMAKAMTRIPEVLNSVSEEGNKIINAVSSGHLRERFNVASYKGGFAALTQGINDFGDAYVNIIDTIPISIICADKNETLLFMNRASQELVGENMRGRKALEVLNVVKRNEGHVTESLGRRAATQNSIQSGEITINPKGKDVIVSVVAAPTHDVSGVPVGYLEIFSDLTEIREAQILMNQVANQASEISDRVATAAEEFSNQIELISQQAENQKVRIDSTASAMSEMNSTVLEVARSASEASEQTEETRKKANNGAELVNKVVQSINGVNTVAVTLQDNMKELGEQAESIGSVMNVISDIADQTNLLALNAAIEAARAGEAGRGFAVVADEVRKLAEKTMSATQEVGASINAIQNSARANIAEVTNAVTNVNDATELANASGNALQEIVSLAAANSAVVASIATAAEEQSATSDEINQSVEEISQIVGEAAQGMVHTSDAIQELSQMSQELKDVMAKLTK